ncbi:hypothetical protein F5Y15DRAFT_42985 [Xylariaceae sp. FL0016]|nr:hypothetical protein F5Y15DRAFT_42985 [Xylariaceae sp. FL0016]
MANWTSIAHLFVVLGQLALFLTATLTFVLGNSTSDDDDWPQLDDFDSQNSSFYVNSTIPWASSAVGAFGLVINLLLWLVLYRADKARMVNLTPTTWGQYKRMTNVASVMMSPFLVGDVAIVAVAGPNSLTSISVVASIAAYV